MTKLSEIANCGRYRIHTIEDRGEESIRLKRMGICADRSLEVLHTGDPMIIRVVGTRVGVSRALAGRVLVSVETVDSAAAEHQAAAS